jgi:hypothetical protein
MKRYRISIAGVIVAVSTIMTSLPAFAQGPNGKSFGIGFQLGDPYAVTARIWTSRLNSWDMAIGSSGLGNPHIQGAYLWHFPQAFNSRVISLYAGVGAVLALHDDDIELSFQKRHDGWWSENDDPRLAIRGVFGMQIVPIRSPLEIFIELDPLFGLHPGMGFAFQPSIGIRFYP